MGLLDDTLSVMAGRKMPPGYSREFTPTEFGMYWHLYQGDERINGGLSPDTDYAYVESCRAAWNHRYSVTEGRPPVEHMDLHEYMALLRHGSDRVGWWTERDVHLR